MLFKIKMFIQYDLSHYLQMLLLGLLLATPIAIIIFLNFMMVGI